MKIGALILRWRAAEGLTQREMAKILSITFSTLCRIENGEEPSGKTLAAILRWMLSRDDG